MFLSFLRSALAMARDLVAREPARFIGYGSALLMWGLAQGAAALHIALPADVSGAFLVIATFIATEVVRHFVSSPATVAALQAGSEGAA